MEHTDSAYRQTLLSAWEEAAKHGQLTLWILLALRDGPKYMAEIRAFMAMNTNGTIAADDRSLYRSLRRYYDSELVEFSTTPGNGPDRKIYRLSSLGEDVLQAFIERNILGIYFKPEIIALLKKGVRRD